MLTVPEGLEQTKVKESLTNSKRPPLLQLPARPFQSTLKPSPPFHVYKEHATVCSVGGGVQPPEHPGHVPSHVPQHGDRSPSLPVQALCVCTESIEITTSSRLNSSSAAKYQVQTGISHICEVLRVKEQDEEGSFVVFHGHHLLDVPHKPLTVKGRKTFRKHSQDQTSSQSSRKPWCQFFSHHLQELGQFLASCFFHLPSCPPHKPQKICLLLQFCLSSVCNVVWSVKIEWIE